MPSIQARLLKPLLRGGMRNSLKSAADFPAERARIEQRERMARYLDRDFTRRQDTLGAIPAEWITTPHSDADTVLLYFHGGGFCVRTPVVHGQLLAKLCAGSGATGLMPDYRLAPEHPFPAAYEDGLASYRWLLEQGYAPAKIAMAGDSAGGSITIGTLLQARDAGLALPACAVLFSPGLGALHDPDAFEGAREGPMLTRESIKAFGEALGAHRHPDHPLRLLIERDFTGLPPLLFQAGGDEILLEDSLQGAARAEAAGVDVQLEVYDGMMHVFQMFAWLPESRRALQQAAAFIKAHLG